MNRLFSFSMKNKLAFNIHSYFNFSTTMPNVNLSNIYDNPGSKLRKLQVGRGPGTKKGKTSGRGHKGKQHGYAPPVHIQGGQTPLTRLLPKINYIRKGQLFAEVNIGKVVELIKRGRLNPAEPITVRHLGLSGAFSKVKNGVKLLGKGAELLDTIPPINIIVNRASKTVIDSILKNKGNIVCEYKSRIGLKFLLKPYKFIKPIRDPVLTYRKAMVYMNLEKLGAKVKFIKPNWMNQEYEKLKEKINKMKASMNAQPNSNLLPVYPVVRYKGMNDNKIRKGNVVRSRKITFEKKATK